MDNCKKGLGYESYNAVPTPYIENFMPPILDLSFTGLDEFVKAENENNHEKSSKEKTKVVKKNADALIIEERVSDDEEENVAQPKIEKKIVKPSIPTIEFFKPRQQEKTARKTVKKVEHNTQNTHRPRGNQRNMNNMMSQKLGINFEMFNKACYVCGSLDHLQANCHYHQKQFKNQKMVKPVWNNAQRVNHKFFAKKTYPSAKKNFVPRAVLMKSGLVLVNTAKQVNAAHQKTIVNAGNPQMDLQDKGVIDSGCSRYMTGNMSYLTNYEEIDEGYVAFGENPKGGKITRKGTKDETSGILKSFITRIKNPVDHKVKVIRCEYRTEFKNKEMNHFCEMKGILRQYSVARTPQQNGFAERRNRTLIKATKSSGPDSLFDIDALTRIMNYEPIVAGTQSNGFADPKSSQDDGFKPSSDDGKKVDEDPSKGSECKDQEKQDTVNNTNNVNTVSSTVIVAGTNELPFDPDMSALEDTGTFNFSNEDEDDGEMANMNNLETTIQVSPTPTTRIHKDHPLDQVIRDLHSATQTRNMSKNLEEHEFIEEEVYMCQPPGFKDSNFLDRVYKVEKALYGLHQAPRAWYETLSTNLFDNVFQRGKFDKTLFIKRHKGELTFFLGLQVKLKNNGIFISQDKYVAEILKKFRFIKVKNASTPMETQKPLLKDEDDEEVDVHMYRSMIGSLMYLTSSRPDIMFAVCTCARYQVNPKVSNLHAMKRIFRYLKGQPKFSFWYPKDPFFDLVAYTDSDYAGASLDRKSTTGDCQYLGSRLISWQCKK
nr:hypothetical protein [Tanacetum cinerariifolium]